MASKITAIRRDDTGSIASYKLEDGTILSREQAVDMANKGELPYVSAFTTRNGDMAIRSDRGNPGYSLDDLPEF